MFLTTIHLMHSSPALARIADLAILKPFTRIFVMGLADYELNADDALEVIKKRHYHEPLCSSCELVFILTEILKRIIYGMNILNPSDLEAYHVVAREILVVARQQLSQMDLSGTVERMRMLRDHLLPLNSFPRRQTAARQGICKVQRTSCSSHYTWEQTPWWGGASQSLKAGSKRGLRETEMFQQFVDEYCGSSVPEGSSKRSKHLGHVIHKTEEWPGESGDGHRNPIDKSQYICRDIIEAVPVSSLDSVPGNEVCKSLQSGILSNIVDALRNLPLLWWFWKEKRTVSASTERIELPSEELTGTVWAFFPNDLQENILQRLEFKDLFRFKGVSKSCKDYIESIAFSQWRGATSSPEGLFTAISYYVKKKAWQCTGFDLRSRKWRSLPTISPTIPAPDAELFKEYSVCGHGGLMCANVAKKGELIVFNPLTRKTFALSSLLNPRSPVLVHISVDSKTKSYKVIVAGSATARDEHLSKKMEVFDSETSMWEEAPDLPGPAFGLNEHQAGVCVDGVLYFISFLEGDCRRGVVAFDVERKKWLDNKACPIPFSMYSNSLQLVENNGKVYLFSEQERGGSVEHCIDMLEIPSFNAGAMEMCHWRNVVRVKKSSGRGLQIYPEHTCVSFGDGKLCVFNTLTRDGVVYDMQDGKQVEVLQPPPPEQKGDNFFSLNPASFTLQPSFDSDPIPSMVDPN